MWGKSNTYSLLVGVQIGAATIEISVWRFLKMLEIDLPHDSVIPLLGIFIYVSNLLFQLMILINQLVVDIFVEHVVSFIFVYQCQCYVANSQVIKKISNECL